MALCKEAFGWVATTAWMGRWLGVGGMLACTKAHVTCKRFKSVSVISKLS